MNKRKVCFVITARASYARTKTYLLSLIQDQNYEVSLILAASAVEDKYGDLESEVKAAGIPVVARFSVLLLKNSLLSNAQETGLLILKLSEYFSNKSPDIVVSVADRYETIATAIAASYLNIPLVHIQGGEVTGNIDDKVRNAVTKLADYHFVATEAAAERVIQMFAKSEVVFKTGCPSIDIARTVIQKWSEINFSERFNSIQGVGRRISLDNPFCVVILHSETEREHEADENTAVIIDSLRTFDGNVVWFWPNSDAGGDRISSVLRKFRENDKDAHRYLFIKTIPPEDALVLVGKANFILGNSSLGVRECGFLGIPTINVGMRQKDRYRGKNVVDVDFKFPDLRGAVESFSRFSRFDSDTYYGVGDAGKHMKAATDKIFQDFLAPKIKNI